MEKIRVLHLELDEHLGGIESFLYNLYSQIDRNAVEFDFITRADNPAKGVELSELEAHIYKISPYNHPFKYMKDLNRVISKGNYDVIHIHKNSAAVVLPFLITKRYKNIRVFVHSHNTQSSVGGAASFLHKINKSFLYKNADIHLACSKVAGEWLYGKRKYKILKNGIITAKYYYDNEQRKAKRQELGILEDAVVLGNVGRFTSQKNQRRLVEIFNKYKKIYPNSWLLLVGDGELKTDVKNYVKQLKIDNVIFTGVRKDIPALMMAMDCFVMPSLYEGLPIVGVEAQATGLKMVVADTVSKEIEISSLVTWFSLKDTNEKITEIIKKTIDTTYNRNNGVNEVKKSGFDMNNTSKILLEMYQDKR